MRKEIHDSLWPSRGNSLDHQQEGEKKCQGNSVGAGMQIYRGILWCPEDGCLTAQGKPGKVSEL